MKKGFSGLISGGSAVLACLLVFGACAKEPAPSGAVKSESGKAVSVSAASQSSLPLDNQLLFEPLGELAADGKKIFDRPLSLPPAEFTEVNSWFQYDENAKNAIIYTGSEQSPDTYTTPLPPKGMARSFATAEGLVAATGQGENGIIMAVVSADGGKSWATCEIEPGAETYVAGLGFSSMENGYMVLQQEEPLAQAAVLITGDGGKTWNKAGAFGITGFYVDGINFADEKTGWLALGRKDGSSGDETDPLVFETADGGRNWQQVAYELPQEISEDLLWARTGTPEWNNGRWVWSLEFNWRGTFGFSPWFSFVLNSEGGWEWDRPGWELKEGLNLPRFISYASNFAVPLEYDINNVTDDNIDFIAKQNWICESSEFMIYTGRWNEEFIQQNADSLNIVIPGTDVQDLIKYRYGISGFDVAKIGGYNPEEKGLEGHIYHEHGAATYVHKVTDVKMLENGDIAVTMDIYTPFVSDGPGDVEFLQAQNCVFRPVEAEGRMFYTLVSSAKAV